MNLSRKSLANRGIIRMVIAKSQNNKHDLVANEAADRGTYSDVLLRIGREHGQCVDSD